MCCFRHTFLMGSRKCIIFVYLCHKNLKYTRRSCYFYIYLCVCLWGKTEHSRIVKLPQTHPHPTPIYAHNDCRKGIISFIRKWHRQTTIKKRILLFALYVHNSAELQKKAEFLYIRTWHKTSHKQLTLPRRSVHTLRNCRKFSQHLLYETWEMQYTNERILNRKWLDRYKVAVISGVSRILTGSTPS